MTQQKMTEYAPYGGTTMRQGITALLTILATMDLIPESKIDALAISFAIIANIAWSLYTKKQALNKQP